MLFKALCKKYSDTLKQYKDVKWTYDIFVRDVLSKYDQIKLVGDGSSRTAFACIGGKCIKVAKFKSGIAQNAQEEKHTARHWWKRTYDCFARTYRRSEGYELLLSECCSRMADEQSLADALETNDISVFTAAIWSIASEKTHDVRKSAENLRAKCAIWRKDGGAVNGVKLSDKSISAAECAAEWLESLLNRRTLSPGKKSFLQITNFWKKYGSDELLPGDICSYQNWGYAIRGTELTPVMLDIGFSRAVADKFYK